MPIFKQSVVGSSELVNQLIRLEQGQPINSKEWEALILSSLKLADRVYKDDRIVGELRSYFRHSWDYWPFRFETAWERFGGEFVILSFTWKNEFNGLSGVIRDTAEFRGLLIVADEFRRKML